MRLNVNIVIMYRFYLLLLMYMTNLVAMQAQTAAQREEAKLREEQLLRQTEEIANLITRLERAEQRMSKLEAEIAQLRNASLATERRITALDAKISKDRDAILDEVAQIVAQSQKTTSAPPPTIKNPTPGGARPAQQQTSTTAQEAGYEYVVRRGDTLSKIVRTLAAQGIKTSVQEISAANNLSDPTMIRVGQKLFIPKR